MSLASPSPAVHLMTSPPSQPSCATRRAGERLRLTGLASRAAGRLASGMEEGITIQKIIRRGDSRASAFKFGIFAGIHGDEPAGVLATLELARWAAEQPEALRDFELHFYPVCNPSGYHLGQRHNQNDLDLNREFWLGSRQPEVLFLERELRQERYDGIIALHADDECDGCYGFVSGALLSEHLLRPALAAANVHLPACAQPMIDGFMADEGIIRQGYLGILGAPPEQRPQALEIVFETPALAPLEQQVAATVAAVKTMLAAYRQLQAYAANL
jgi:protein MpaA